MDGKGIERIAEGVYGLVGGGVNVYLIDGGESGLTAIDAGLPGWKGRILALVGAAGGLPGDLKRVLVTHADVDHVGALSALVDATGAEVWASERSARYIGLRVSPPHIGFPMSVPVALLNFFGRRATRVARILRDGESLDIGRSLGVVGSPGHTPDHLCFFLEDERILFAGDLFRNVRGLEMFPRNAWSESESKASADRALALEPAMICPGHGRVWRAGGDARPGEQ